MMPYQVSQKLIISGDYLEVYKFEKSYWVGWPRERRYRPHRPHFRSQADQELIRDDNVRRTRIKIRRLVNCNHDLDRFMTLTFNTPLLDLNKANPLFRNFVKRLSRLYPQFKYLCVPEFQPNSGRVHYHLLCNLPYIEKSELESLWSHGFVFIRKVDSVDNMGAYVCKYLGKANFDKRYFRKNKFFYSYNLLRSVIIDKLLSVTNILENLPKTCKLIYNLSFNTEFLGLINYLQYRLTFFDYLNIFSFF